jgi:hypothetical protein
VALFKLLKLDAMLHGVNAAGLSAFNPGERRMAPLSRLLSGLLLRHDRYGNHLDSSGKTIDLPLEIRNFYGTMDVLSEIWNKLFIDKYPVYCKPVDMGCEFVPEPSDPIWNAKHVLQSRYGLQIVKCLDTQCCEPFQTNWLQVFPDRFLPPPTVYNYGGKGLEVVEPSVYLKTPKLFKFARLQDRLITKLTSNEAKKNKKGELRPVPFDAYCPSMQSKIDGCICSKCGSYWPSQASKNRHYKAHKMGLDDEKIEEEDEISDQFDSEDEEEETLETDSDAMPVFSTKQHLFYPFEKVAFKTTRSGKKFKK